MGDSGREENLERILYAVETGFDAIMRPYMNIYAYIIVFHESRFLQLTERTSPKQRSKHRNQVDEALKNYLTEEDSLCPQEEPVHGGQAYIIYTGKASMERLEGYKIPLHQVNQFTELQSQRACDERLHDNIETYLDNVCAKDSTPCLLVTFDDEGDIYTTIHEWYGSETPVDNKHVIDTMQPTEVGRYLREHFIFDFMTSVIDGNAEQISLAHSRINSFARGTPFEKEAETLVHVIEKYAHTKPQNIPALLDAYIGLIKAKCTGIGEQRELYESRVAMAIQALED